MNRVGALRSLAACGLFVCGCVAGGDLGGKPPSGAFSIRPYLRSPGQTEMTIGWTSAEQLPFVLVYGEGDALDKKQEVGALAEPIEYLPRPRPNAAPPAPDAPTPPEPEKKREYQYLARLTGLRPGTEYRYRVSAGAEEHVGSFRTFPVQAEEFTFIAFADSQSPSILRRAATSMTQQNPRFLLLAGDMIEHGHIYQDWNEHFFTPLAGVLDRVPLMPARGNHDGSAFLPRLFAFPEKRLYYSFDYADAHFVALDSSQRGDSRQAMLEWCDADLAASRARWKIVYYHHPSYDAGANEPDCWGRGDFVPVFRKHGVDLVLGGHTHAYQRFRPMFTEGENKEHPITFLVVGGLGAAMRVSQDPYLAMARSANHYVVVSVSANALSVRAVELDGSTVDAFEIRKGDDGRPDEAYRADAVPEQEYGGLRRLVAPCLQGLTLSDNLRTGRPAKARMLLRAGDRMMRFTVQLERRAQRVFEMTPVSGEVRAGEEKEVEVSIRLQNPAAYADETVALPVLRLECVFDIGGQRASVFSNRLVWHPPPDS